MRVEVCDHTSRKTYNIDTLQIKKKNRSMLMRGAKEEC